MTLATRLVSSTGFLVLFAAAGCSTGPSTPTASQYDDVAQSMSAIVSTPGGGGEVRSMADTASLAVGVTPTTLSVNGQGSFNGVIGGLNYAYAVACTDTNGSALPHCGSTTNTAHATVTWSGTLSVPGVSASVDRSGDWTVAGLQTGTATFDGKGTFSYHGQFQSAFRNEQATSSLSFDATYAGVTYDESLHHVTGGTVHYVIDASLSASSTSGQANGAFAIDAVLTFAADGSARLVLDATHSYAVSASGFVTKG